MNTYRPLARCFVTALLGLATADAGLVLAAAAVAQECGDEAGPGGSRIACACGDTVVTSTKLRKKDPVVANVCPSTALFIDRDNVTLNCRNRTLTGEGSGSGIALQGSVIGVEIKNCRVMGFGVGIDLGRPPVAEVSEASIRHNWLINNRGNGIEGEFDQSIIRGNRIEKNGGHGIALDFAFINTIRGNLVQKNQRNGIDLRQASGNSIVGNIFNKNGEDGIFAQLSQNDYKKNKMNDNGDDGMELDTAEVSLVEGNKASRNRGLGINGDGDENLYRFNMGDRNGGTGLRVIGDANLLKKNKFNQNGGDGICAEADILANIDDGGNRGRKNAGVDVSFTGPCT